MRNIITKFFASFLIILFIGINSSVPLYLHKCFNKKITYISILKEPKCEHNQVKEECCTEIEDLESTACQKCQNSCSMDEDAFQASKIQLFGSLFCCSNQKFFLRLSENLIYQNPEHKTIHLSFEYIRFSIFQNLEKTDLKKLTNNTLFHPNPRKFLLRFIQISSQNKSVDVLPPSVS